MPAQKQLTLGVETWGERVRRAYRRARDTWGDGFNYRSVAEQISLVYPVSMTALQRLEQNEELPKQPRVRIVAFYALLAYGFDPADFGLTDENTPVANIDLRKTRQLLAPRNRGYAVSAANHDTLRRSAA